MKKRLYIDMDGVIVDLRSNIEMWFENHRHLIKKYENYPDHIPGIFRDPKPIQNSIKSILQLQNSNKFDMFIATSVPWGNPDSASDKRYWIEKYFGDLFHKKLITTHRKDLLQGDFLIDDRLKNGAKEFNGKLLRFGWDFDQKKQNEFPNWDSILDYLL